MTAEKKSNQILRPLEERDFDAVAALARSIWLAHYTTLITTAQIEYMLRGRFAPDNLRIYLRAEDRWMDLLEIDGELAGYCSYALTSEIEEMKLEQLYLRRTFTVWAWAPRCCDTSNAARLTAARER